ncbi:hypothetical protein IID26_02215 [Patescibacteria group bacterium]|nr:hypothetical protein [Patescibacteria group bacterium]
MLSKKRTLLIVLVVVVAVVVIGGFFVLSNQGTQRDLAGRIPVRFAVGLVMDNVVEITGPFDMPVKVVNAGSEDDSYSLSVVSKNGFVDVSLSSDTLSIPAKSEETITLHMNPNTEFVTDIVKLRVTSNRFTSNTDGVEVTVTISAIQ